MLYMAKCMSPDDCNSTNRRTVLKATAGLAAMSSVAGVANATRETKTRLERTVDEAHRILEKTGDREKYIDYMAKRTNTTWVNRTYSVPHGSSEDDGPSTEKISRSDLDISIMLSVDCWGDASQYYADLSWSYDSSWTEPPYDYAGLIWDTNWWDLYYDDSYSDSFPTSDYVSYKDGTFTGDGPAFEVDDYLGYDSYCWGGAYITPIGDYSSTQRRVYGRYSHTWDRVEVQSVSIGFSASGPSLSVSLSDETKEWQTDSEQDGDTPLYVHQNDAYC